MSKFYVCCDLGTEGGRMTLGTLHRDRLTLGEIRRLDSAPKQGKGARQWNIGSLHQQVLGGLQETGRFEEPVEGISCTSSADDYLLFDSGGSVITPVYHHGDVPAAGEGTKVLSKLDIESIYQETGVSPKPGNTLAQLGGESWLRLRRASRLLPVADAFNFLLSGVPRVELSQASATQLYNPVAQCWSERVMTALKVSPGLLPPVVPGGTQLAGLDAEIARETGLHGARVVASCSHQLAAAIAGLPVADGEDWAFLHMGAVATLGTQLSQPLISRESLERGFTNELGYAGGVRFSKRMAGSSLLDACHSHWKQRDRELAEEVLMHLASCSEPFESLINPADPCFQSGGDLVAQIQEFCARTGQSIPRKPGSVIRCVMESLALQYRRGFRELGQRTGRKFTRLYLLGNTSNSLLNHFIANALEVPLAIVQADVAAVGSVMTQAMALGQVRSRQEARDIIRSSVKTQIINPQARLWSVAYDRFSGLDDSEATLALQA